MKKGQIKKVLFFSIGCVCLGLAGIGIPIPVWPTTPFVILASACFAISSRRMNLWLEESDLFGEFIKNYRKKTGVSRKTKGIALLYLWVMLIVSMSIIQKLTMTIILSCIGSAVTIHILCIRSRE